MKFDFDDNTFSDLVKEVYGTRGPAREYGHLFYYYDETPGNKQKIWDELCNELEIQMAEDKAWKAKQVAAFEARIQETIVLGAGNRKTAIRWILEGEFGVGDDTLLPFDPGYACFKFNLPYSFEEEFRGVFA